MQRLRVLDIQPFLWYFVSPSCSRRPCRWIVLAPSIAHPHHYSRRKCLFWMRSRSPNLDGLWVSTLVWFFNFCPTEKWPYISVICAAESSSCVAVVCPIINQLALHWFSQFYVLLSVVEIPSQPVSFWVLAVTIGLWSANLAKRSSFSDSSPRLNSRSLFIKMERRHPERCQSSVLCFQLHT